jgi:3-methyladenine DNA glycosylase AlkC
MLLNIQMMNLRQSKELLDNMKEDNILYQKKTLEDNANYDIYTKEKRTFNPSSNIQKTRQHAINMACHC